MASRTPKPGLSPKEYWDKHGREKVQALCEAAGTKYSYWKHVANGRKRFSPDLAHKLVEHSNGELDFAKLLPAKD